MAGQRNLSSRHRGFAIKYPLLVDPNPKANAMRQITPSELHKRLSEGETKPLLLDVREPGEFRYCHIAGSVNLPMTQVPGRCGELKRDDEIVVICHHGMRSSQVANFLIGQGYQDVSNLSGGVDAWARQVDTAMPVY